MGADYWRAATATPCGTQGRPGTPAERRASHSAIAAWDASRTETDVQLFEAGLPVRHAAQAVMALALCGAEAVADPEGRGAR